MSRAIMTVCTADYFQFYIPIFMYSISKCFPDVDVYVFLRGGLDENVHDALRFCGKYFGNLTIVPNHAVDYPNLKSTTNSLRFVTSAVPKSDETFITDIDFFFTKTSQDIFRYCEQNRFNDFYFGTHGPFAKPHRPEVCPSWSDHYERVAGGFFMAYKGWWEKTYQQRMKYDELLSRGDYGYYREADEVMLARIIKESGLPMPAQTPLPREVRNVHLGDFKTTMKHRYTNRNKMRAILDIQCVNDFLRAKSDPVFIEIRKIVSKNAQMKQILDIAFDYCEKRQRNEM